MLPPRPGPTSLPLPLQRPTKALCSFLPAVTDFHLSARIRAIKHYPFPQSSIDVASLIATTRCAHDLPWVEQVQEGASKTMFHSPPRLCIYPCMYTRRFPGHLRLQDKEDTVFRIDVLRHTESSAIHVDTGIRQYG